MSLFKSKKQSSISTDIKHIAFIMDGNGRWATKQMLSRSAGHKAGVERIMEILDSCRKDYGIEHMSLFVFSSENWKRSKEEIDYLFGLLKTFFESHIEEMIQRDVKINILGDLEDTRIPKETLDILNKSMSKTNHCKSGTFNVLFNYGGQQDILQACKKIASEYANSSLKLDDLNITNFSSYLYSGDLPNVDLLVRTSGEMRISNCFLYQLAYAELSFPQDFWPDFNTKSLRKVIEDYNQRNRRFGGVK